MTRSTKLYEHCVKLYEGMDKDAVDAREGRVWRGALTHLLTEELGIAIGYYTPIIKKLEAMGCIDQFQRGGGGTPSIWVLRYPPSLELYGDTGATTGVSSTTKAKFQELDSASDAFRRRIADLERQMQDMIHWRNRMQRQLNEAMWADQTTSQPTTKVIQDQLEEQLDKMVNQEQKEEAIDAND